MYSIYSVRICVYICSEGSSGIDLSRKYCTVCTHLYSYTYIYTLCIYIYIFIYTIYQHSDLSYLPRSHMSSSFKVIVRTGLQEILPAVPSALLPYQSSFYACETFHKYDVQRFFFSFNDVLIISIYVMLSVNLRIVEYIG